MFQLPFICCICLNDTNKVYEYNLIRVTYKDEEILLKLETCGFCTDWMGPGVTIYICRACHHLLDISYKFLTTCQDSSTRFRDYLIENDNDNDDCEQVVHEKKTNETIQTKIKNAIDKMMKIMNEKKEVTINETKQISKRKEQIEMGLSENSDEIEQSEEEQQNILTGENGLEISINKIKKEYVVQDDDDCDDGDGDGDDDDSGNDNSNQEENQELNYIGMYVDDEQEMALDEDADYQVPDSPYFDIESMMSQSIEIKEEKVIGDYDDDDDDVEEDDDDDDDTSMPWNEMNDTNEQQPTLTIVPLSKIIHSNMKTGVKNNAQTLKRNSEEKLFQCPFCPKVVKKKQNLPIHIRGMHKNVRPYKCTLCSSEYSYKCNLKKHMYIHIGYPWICPTCGKGFVQSYLLRKHLRRHNGVKAYICTTCEKTFNSPAEWLKHLDAHPSFKTCICPICGKVLQDLNALRLHMQNHPALSKEIQNIPMMFNCTVCNMVFNNETEFNSHIESHTEKDSDAQSDSKDIISFNCTVCDDIFQNEVQLKTHMATHRENTRAYTCSTCDKQFYYESQLLKHMRIHSKDGKSYACFTCDKRFYYQSHLINHMYIHPNVEKPYHCSTCQKSFYCEAQLLKHMRLHSDDGRMYKCSECDKKYYYQSQLLQHMPTHSNVKPFKCVRCNAKFKNDKSLKSHMKFH